MKKPRRQGKPNLLQFLLQQEAVKMSRGERCKILAPHGIIGNDVVCNICLPERLVVIGRTKERTLEQHVKGKSHLWAMRKYLIVGAQ